MTIYFTFSGNPCIPLFKLHLPRYLMQYIINYYQNIINVSHDVSLVIYVVTSIHSIQRKTRSSKKLGNKRETVRRFKARKWKEIQCDRQWWSWWVMMRLVSWSCIMMQVKNQREKKRTGIWKRILINTPFAKYALSENLYILILCCQWWSTINLFSNRWANWGYSRSSFTRNI